MARTNNSSNFIMYNSCSMHNCIKTYNKKKFCQYWPLKSSITIECSRENFTQIMFFPFSVVYIKEEPTDAASLANDEPEMKPLLDIKSGFNVTNYSMDEIDIKEEPLQDDLVSELLNRLKKNMLIFIDNVFIITLIK